MLKLSESVKKVALSGKTAKYYKYNVRFYMSNPVLKRQSS